MKVSVLKPLLVNMFHPIKDPISDSPTFRGRHRGLAHDVLERRPMDIFHEDCRNNRIRLRIFQLFN